MSSRYKVHDDQLPHFLTFTVVGWVDALSREMYKEIICNSLLYCTKEKGVLLHGWVIMNNHLHLIVSMDVAYKMGDFVRDFKKFTSKKIIEAIDNNMQESRRAWMINMFEYAGRNKSTNNKEYQFWQHDYHPVVLDTEEKVCQRLNYLHQNPVRAGIVWQAEHYKYSSATDYLFDIKGLLPLSMLQV